MKIRPIRTKTDYRAALKDIDGLMTARRDTPEGERLDVLVTLVEAYERKHYPLDAPDPVEAIRFEMERKGLLARDLVPMIGRLNRIYEILSRKRPLTLHMIWKLHKGLGIPAESLIKPAVKPRSNGTRAVTKLHGSLKHLRRSTDKLMALTRGEH